MQKCVFSYSVSTNTHIQIYFQVLTNNTILYITVYTRYTY